MNAVGRVIAWEGGRFARWRVLQSTPPVHERDVLKQAVEMAEVHRFDPLICDAIINLPTLPLQVMHSWWNRPNRVLDVRPVELVTMVRFYRLTYDGRIVHFDIQQPVREYQPLRDTPLAPVASLFPYGTDTFFTQR